MVYVLVFTPIILLSLLMLYNSGKLTDEKMKLQNAADATAYSISTLEARDLNFTAYTNRAMIGNEIAIAQLVGLYSWLDMWGSTLQFFDLYIITPLEGLAAGTLGILSAIPGIVKAIKETMVKGVEAVKKGVKTVGKVATKGVAAINLAYSYAQLGMHSVTVLLSLSVINEVIADNAPGAKLSDFGFFALAAHIGTYYANPKFEQTFVHHNAATAKEEMGLLMRKQYAATVNGSRDQFSMDRGGGWSQALFDIDNNPMNLSFDDPLGGEINFGFSADIGLGKLAMSIEAGAFFAAGASVERRGGTDLRLTEQTDKQYYSWTGVDVIALNMWIKFNMYLRGCAEVEALGITVVDECLDILDLGIDKDKNPLVWLDIFGSEMLSLGSDDISTTDDPNENPLKAKISWFGMEIVEFEFPLRPEIDVPFGVGTGQIASPQGIMTTPEMYGVDDGEYGRAPGDLPIAYNFPGACSPPSPKGDCGVPMNMGMPDSLIFNGHKGLPPFNSVVPIEIMSDLAKKHPKLKFIENINFFAPNLVIGLVKERSDITTSSEIIKATSTHLKLDNDAQDGELAVIAKSEVYFSRPTDSLAIHFNRIDDKTEYGSTYNPFWQARLIETQIPERVIALLFQQKQIWALAGVSLTLPLGLGTFDLNAMLKDLGLI